jgi:hypothetical protein
MVVPEYNEASPEGTDVQEIVADPAEVAFESVFDSVSTLYRVTGSILHQLIGLEFRSGRAHDAHIEVVRAPDRVGVLIQRMRRRWGAVAHVRMAELLPGNMTGLDHPERRTMVVIEIHVGGKVATACCRVNPQTRELFSAPLAINCGGDTAAPPSAT